MINFNSNIPPVAGRSQASPTPLETPKKLQTNFTQQIQDAGKAVGKVDDLQQISDASIQDLLTGKNNDITSVVSDVAKADMSFKLLVGVRNKLIEAYQQTMNMQI